jgi:hypothetical protein
LTADPGNTNTAVVTLSVLGTPQALTCTVTGDGSHNFTCNDTTHSVSVTAGQTGVWNIVFTGSSLPSTEGVLISAQYQ